MRHVCGVALRELLNFSQPCSLMCKMRTIIIHFMGFERINKERFLPHADNLLKACSILIMQPFLSEVKKSIPREVWSFAQGCSEMTGDRLRKTHTD